MKHTQTTSRVLMVRPAAFGQNPETVATNAFQGKPLGTPAQIHAQALAEFDALVGILREQGVEVFVFEDTIDPPKPDAIFPNNWFTTHDDGTVTLYPMQPKTRRGERRPDLFESLAEDHGFHVARFVDFTDGESSGLFLEGTGSLVLDHLGMIGYAALSARTRAPVLERFSGAFDCEIVSFRATDKGIPIYHTNVILSIGRTFAVLADETIDDPDERRAVKAKLREGGRRVIPISRAQARSFCANILELRGANGDPIIVCSTRAWGALDPHSQAKLQEHGKIVTAHVPTIEDVGGGSVRCMLAELFLPKFSVAQVGELRRARSTGGAPRRG